MVERENGDLQGIWVCEAIGEPQVFGSADVIRLTCPFINFTIDVNLCFPSTLIRNGVTLH